MSLLAMFSHVLSSVPIATVLYLERRPTCLLLHLVTNMRRHRNKNPNLERQSDREMYEEDGVYEESSEGEEEEEDGLRFSSDEVRSCRYL